MVQWLHGTCKTMPLHAGGFETGAITEIYGEARLGMYDTAWLAAFFQRRLPLHMYV